MGFMPCSWGSVALWTYGPYFRIFFSQKNFFITLFFRKIVHIVHSGLVERFFCPQIVHQSSTCSTSKYTQTVKKDKTVLQALSFAVCVILFSVMILTVLPLLFLL